MLAIMKRASLTVVALTAMCALPALAQTDQSTPRRPEIALDYTFLHSNAPPGSCGCFSLNGGSATAAFPLGVSRWSISGDVTLGHTGSVSATGKSLTLSNFTVGTRYQIPSGNFRFHPFLQILVGAAHAGGAIAQSQNASAINSGAVFAANLGGGIDLPAGRRLSVRVLELDDALTTFNNNVNNYQNILRVSSGIVVRFGR